MTRLWTAAAGLSLALLPAACEGPAADTDFVQTDSAGIPILESFRQAWEEGQGWTIASEPELAIGAGVTGGDDPNHPPWGFIRAVSVLSNGSLVVGDISTSDVMVFDTLGAAHPPFRREGRRSGRTRGFRSGVHLRWRHNHRGRSLYVQFFDSEGRFIRRLATVDGQTRTPLEAFLTSADCQRCLVTEDPYRTPAPEGPEGLTYWVYAWTDDSFTGRDTVARTAARHVYQYGIFPAPSATSTNSSSSCRCLRRRSQADPALACATRPHHLRGEAAMG